jgi:hypothetical protein
MAEHASPVTTARIAGRTYIAVTDLLTLLDDMAAAMTGTAEQPASDRAQGATDILGKFAAMLQPLVSGREVLPDTPLATPTPCPGCRQPVRNLPRITPGQHVTLDSDHTHYGAWMTMQTISGHKAAPYERTKHASYNIARYREHHCGVNTSVGSDG